MTKLGDFSLRDSFDILCGFQNHTFSLFETYSEKISKLQNTLAIYLNMLNVFMIKLDMDVTYNPNN